MKRSIIFRGIAAALLFVSVSNAFASTSSLYLLASDTAHTVIESSEEEQFGSTIQKGDFDGDGKEDIAMGAPAYGTKDIPGRGRVLVKFSSDNHELSILGADRDDQFGTAIAFGDLNQDNVDDLIIGAPGASKVYALFGRSSFYQAEIDIGVYAPSIILIGKEEGERFGFALDIFDFNQDGKKDLFIGAPKASESSYKKIGKIYSFSGRSYFPDHYVKHFGLETPELAFLGSRTREELGTAIAHGDFNADGIQDLAAGAFRASFGLRKEAGKVSVFFGRQLPLNGTRSFVIVKPSASLYGASPHDWLSYALTSADLNQDGISDLIMTSFSLKSRRHGSVSIVFGRENFHTLQETDLKKKRPDILIKASRFPVTLGASIQVYDIDFDGAPDLLLGVPSLRAPGRVYIYLGKNLLKRSYLITERSLPDRQIFGVDSGDWLGAAITVVTLEKKLFLMIGAPFKNTVYMVPL